MTRGKQSGRWQGEGDIICIHRHNWSEDTRKNGLNQKGCKGCLRASEKFHREMGL